MLPWWALSPSPFTLVFYGVLALYTMRKLLAEIEYRRLKYLFAFSDSVFLIGFVVLSLDIIWVFASGFRWLSLHPDSYMQLVYSQARNVVGVFLCCLIVGGYIKRFFRFTSRTFILLTTITLFTFLWFRLAPSPAYTDWTYAIKYGYPTSVVLQSFLTSHVIGKTLTGLIYWSLWMR